MFDMNIISEHMFGVKGIKWQIFAEFSTFLNLPGLDGIISARISLAHLFCMTPE